MPAHTLSAPPDPAPAGPPAGPPPPAVPPAPYRAQTPATATSPAQRQARACQPAPAPARIEERDVCGRKREVPESDHPGRCRGTSAAAPADPQQTSPWAPAPRRSGQTLRIAAEINRNPPAKPALSQVRNIRQNFCRTTGTPRKRRPGCQPADRGVPARGFTGANRPRSCDSDDTQPIEWASGTLPIRGADCRVRRRTMTRKRHMLVVMLMAMAAIGIGGTRRLLPAPIRFPFRDPIQARQLLRALQLHSSLDRHR
jgi:hypothetical protein